MLKLTVSHDEFAEDPLNDSEWKLYSFSHRHTNSRSHEDFFQNVDRYGDVNWQIGFKRKAQYGLAHILSCYQHSGTSWSLKGEGTQCRWDTAQLAGVLVWEGKAADCGSIPEEREAYARGTLETYTEWLNGGTYEFTLEDEENDIHESCGGFYGSGQELAEHMLEHICVQLDGTAFEFHSPEYVATEQDFYAAMVHRREILAANQA
jgi:hypothetical protein